MSLTAPQTPWHRLAPEIETILRRLRGTVLSAFREPQTESMKKEDGSPVTALDLALEQQIVEPLLALDEAFGLRSEEAGTVRERDLMWQVDPLDGTANFAARIQNFATQIVLMHGHHPLFAAIYEPLTDDFSWAARGHGAFREGRRLEMTDPEPRRARLHLDLSNEGLFVRHPSMPMELRRSCYRVRSLGSIAIHLRDVASGAAHGYLGGRGPGTPIHDVAPGMLLVREAGGRTSDGNGHDPLLERDILIAGTPRVHDWLAEEVTRRENLRTDVPTDGLAASMVGMTITLLTFEGGIEDFPSLVQTLDGLVDEGGQRVALDLGCLPFINSAALGYLLKAHQGLTAKDGELALCSLQPAIANILQMTQLDKIFPIFNAPEEAVAYLGGNPEDPIPDDDTPTPSTQIRSRRWASK